MGKTTRLTTEEFIKRAKEIHGNKYNYSMVEYINAEKLYLENKKRDKKKNSLCKENGVKLFYINYYDNLNDELEKVLKICSG
jgi:hypothetical protein